VNSLDRATAGDRPASARYSEVMAPLELGDELRAALVSGGRCWGVMCLHRADSPLGFSVDEIALVRRLVPHVAEGLRRAVVVQAMTAASGTIPSGPGVVLLDDEMSVTSMNQQAEQWLADLGDTGWTGTGGDRLPVLIYTAAARAALADLATETIAPTTRFRTNSGQWLTVHTSRLRGPSGWQTAVVLESARPVEMASLFLEAHGLTPAQSRVATLVLQGRSTRQIVNELHVSTYTVQEHLKAVFDKFGIGSRRELVATLLGGSH
jgi:DNA-binding CsgD family transcriptional regulator